jgi:D-sedoheptulose 7-phosphate isomerase
MKTCSKCNLIKDFNEFRVNRNMCKSCEKEYRINNKEKERLQKKEYAKNNIDKLKNRSKIYYINNKEKIDNKNRAYYYDNKDIINNKNREYYKNNKELTNAYQRKRLKTDPNFKLRKRVSHSIWQFLKLNGGSKENKSILNYLPYTIDELKQHLELLFDPWMNWNNYGPYKVKEWDDNNESTWKWQIDHIIPQSEFKFSSMEEKEFKECWALSNLRPLSSKNNNCKSNKMPSFIEKYLIETHMILSKINIEDIEKLISQIKKIKDNCGRLFFLGIGGSAGTCSHAVNDFRKICDIQCYCPTDNVSLLTAITNDMGFEHIFVEYLKESQINSNDALFICSVGGGNLEKNISIGLINSVKYAKERSVTVLGIVGKDNGYTALNATNCVIIPSIFPDRITAHTEGLCSVLLHLIVSHPDLKVSQTKWESLK